jgi:glucan phosphoethanolaminetransferase (alkaline phosphatase superfamily)
MKGGILPLLLAAPTIVEGAKIGVSLLPIVLGIITIIISLIILIFGVIFKSKGVKIASYIGFGLGIAMILSYMIMKIVQAAKKNQPTQSNQMQPYYRPQPQYAPQYAPQYRPQNALQNIPYRQIAQVAQKLPKVGPFFKSFA